MANSPNGAHRRMCTQLKAPPPTARRRRCSACAATARISGAGCTPQAKRREKSAWCSAEEKRWKRRNMRPK